MSKPVIDANLPARPNYIAVPYINASVERLWKARGQTQMKERT